MKYIFFAFFFLFLFSCHTSKTDTQVQVVKSNQTMNVLNLGADPSGSQDNTMIFQKAINSGKKVFVPSGKYRLDGMVEVKGPFHIEAGTTIIRMKNKSSNTAPMFWLNTNYATLIGEDKTVKLISENESPSGVVKIGHESARDIKTNINFCEVRNLLIKGSGKENLRNNTGVLIFNSQGNGSVKSSYFHTLRNLIIQQFNTGIHLKGLANANSISGIVFNRVGKSNDDYAIIIDGAMENRIYDVFHHHSKNANTILMRAYNHELSGKSIVPVFNDIFGVVAEPGGPEARCFVAQAGKFNKVRIGCNTKLGFRVYPEYFNNRNEYNTNKGKARNKKK